MKDLIFLVLGSITVLSATGVVISRNLVYAVLSFALFLCSIAGLYITLNAEFLAILQIFVYVGAVVVLFLFVIMLTSKIRDKSISRSTQQKYPAIFICAIFCFTLIFIFNKLSGYYIKELENPGDIKQIAASFLTTYVVAFEMLSILLLIAIVGAVALIRKRI
jgi:NADH-quinone oxidoreductase subunit J